MSFQLSEYASLPSGEQVLVLGNSRTSFEAHIEASTIDISTTLDRNNGDVDVVIYSTQAVASQSGALCARSSSSGTSAIAVDGAETDLAQQRRDGF